MARSNELMLHREAGYMNATGFQNQSRYLCARAESIHEPNRLDSPHAEDWTGGVIVLFLEPHGRNN